tara:strand:- start:528 stop:809 length:282 start_codon:yes stop_codon:yes gene_type:complete
MIFNQSKNSENKYLLGIIMIAINIGARFIIEDLTPEQKELVNNHITRKIIAFLIFYMATKDILASITLTVIYILFMSDLISEILQKNEKSLYI